MKETNVFHQLVIVLSFLINAALCGYIPPGPKYPCPENPSLFYPCKCTSGSDLGLEIYCGNSNLASLSIAFTNIAALRSPLEKLTIAAAKFSRLYGGLLYALEVKRLYIEDTPLKKIAPQTFLGVNRTLEELHLVRTQLNEYPKDAFQNLGKLRILHIDGHTLTTLSVGSIAGLLPNNLERLSITNGNLTDLPVDTLVPLKKLKRLDLHGNNFKTLKRNQFKDFYIFS
uniref:Secreted Chaoptin-like protein n=1 Tax=Pristhesancus plagipennis TaxID=1955184 RepID=A0A2K8JM71_PRIPG|nr:secreted Chaoptin-like protein [Pristhesancus plagipennis]